MKVYHVLVVEDEDMVADAYRMQIEEEEQFTVTIAEDGEKALEILQKGETPDLIILDLLMPRTNGLKLLEKLNKQRLTDKIPIVVATNLEDANTVHKALKLGARDYFIKSDVTTGELLSLCLDILKPKR